MGVLHRHDQPHPGLQRDVAATGGQQLRLAVKAPGQPLIAVVKRRPTSHMTQRTRGGQQLPADRLGAVGLVDHPLSAGELVQCLVQYRPTAAALITSAQLLRRRPQVPDMRDVNPGGYRDVRDRGGGQQLRGHPVEVPAVHVISQRSDVVVCSQGRVRPSPNKRKQRLPWHAD